MWLGEFPLWAHKLELVQKPRDISMETGEFLATDAGNLINVAKLNF
jgi:hypothetical protein